MAPISAANASAFARSRPATRISVKARTRGIACAWARAWTPVPRMASVVASSRARRRVDSAEPAAVRSAVIAVPSRNAVGSPVSGSNAAMTAWWVGSVVFCGKTLTSLLVSASEDGTRAGIAPRNAARSGICAATRGGDDARPALRSDIAAARASMSSSRSRSRSTSERLRISIRRP